MSISVLDIIAFFFFVPLALLVIDRLRRAHATAAQTHGELAPQEGRDARQEVSDRYRQVIGDLKRLALQPKWLPRASEPDGSTAGNAPSETSVLAGSRSAHADSRKAEGSQRDKRTEKEIVLSRE
jgi:hypothetical protein